MQSIWEMSSEECGACRFLMSLFTFSILPYCLPFCVFWDDVGCSMRLFSSSFYFSPPSLWCSSGLFLSQCMWVLPPPPNPKRVRLDVLRAKMNNFLPDYVFFGDRGGIRSSFCCCCLGKARKLTDAVAPSGRCRSGGDDGRASANGCIMDFQWHRGQWYVKRDCNNWMPGPVR